MAVSMAVSIAGNLPGNCETLESITFDSRWPDASPNNIIADPLNNVVFYGTGNTLTLVNPQALPSNDMAELSRIELDITRGITGLCQDVSGKIVYAACGDKGFALVDVSDLSNPVVVKTILLDPDKDPIHATAVDYMDNRLYISDVYFGLRIMDVSNPLNPTQAGVYEQSSSYTDSDGNLSSYSGGHINLKVAEINSTKYAFVLDKYYGLRIFDVSIDSSPTLVTQYDMRSKQLYGQLSVVVDLAVDQRYLYISDATNGITILDMFSNENDPKSISITKKGQIETPGAASGVNLSGNTLYVADGNSGLFVVDVSDRSAPAHLATYPATGAYGVDEAGGKIFLADTVDGIARIESSAQDLVKTASFNTPSNADALFVDATHAYILDNNGPKEGMVMISLSDTGQYSFTGAIATPGNATGLYVTDTKAYVADGSSGITIINIEDKTSPVIAGTFKPGGNACDILVHDFDSTAYIADKQSGLIIAQVTDQGLLTEKASLYMEKARALAYMEQEEKSYILVVNEEGLYIIDVSDTDSPVVAGHMTTNGKAMDVGVKDNYAIVADGENGVLLIDVSDPATPIFSASYNTNGSATALFIHNSYIHVADKTDGVQILGTVATEPVEIVLITNYDTPGNACDIFVNGTDDNRYTYVADGRGGFLSFLHSDRLSGGIDEKPFTESPDDTGWDRADGGPSCFISTLLF